jgi:hypothetical protein
LFLTGKILVDRIRKLDWFYDGVISVYIFSFRMRTQDGFILRPSTAFVVVIKKLNGRSVTFVSYFFALLAL